MPGLSSRKFRDVLGKLDEPPFSLQLISTVSSGAGAQEKQAKYRKRDRDSVRA